MSHCKKVMSFVGREMLKNKTGNFEKETLKNKVQKSKNEGNFLSSTFKAHIRSEIVFSGSACCVVTYYLH